jgi:uncharacterized protein (DUF1501 family)
MTLPQHLRELIMFNRRDFLKTSSLFALAPTVPVFLARTARAALDKAGRVLVVVQLDGGNDALNTAVPHSDPEYAKLRPRLKIQKTRLLAVSDAVGLHPSLRPLDKLLQAEQLATVVGVGYPNPNRSHFESMTIWNTADPRPDQASYGWVGRALDPSAGTAYALGNSAPLALRGRRSMAITMNRLEDVTLVNPTLSAGAADVPAPEDTLSFVRRQTADARMTAERMAKLSTGAGTPYPATGLAERLKLTAQLLKGDLGARVFYTQQGGFDTHAAQQTTHANLLSEFAAAVAAFFEDLRAAKLAERVVLMAFSEFGRTIRENDSAGTDHGTAGVVFLAGPGIRGGLHGTFPSLTDLAGGEPKMTTDFRRIYAAVLASWLGLPTADVLGREFEPLPIFRT